MSRTSGWVEIGRTVDYETLEKALIQAAEKMGFRARVEDQFEHGYRLGSVHETKEYSHTLVNLRGRFLPAMTVYIADKGTTDKFSVWDGMFHGFASKTTVKEYLSAVSGALATAA